MSFEDWSRNCVGVVIPSLTIPTARHFWKRQYWHRFRRRLSTGQLFAARHTYLAFFCTVRCTDKKRNQTDNMRQKVLSYSEDTSLPNPNPNPTLGNRHLPKKNGGDFFVVAKITFGNNNASGHYFRTVTMWCCEHLYWQECGAFFWKQNFSFLNPKRTSMNVNMQKV